MQFICGKRAECIENRRERLLSQLQNKNVQAALRRIPPSSEYFFSKEKLAPLIQSLEGSQNWLNTLELVNTWRPRDHFRIKILLHPAQVTTELFSLQENRPRLQDTGTTHVKVIPAQSVE